MSLDPPKVLLDASFLDALARRDSAHHADCAAVYSALLDDVAAGRVLLVAVGDHLHRHLPALPDHPAQRLVALVRRVLRPTGLFAPVHALHVAGQHRRAARRSTVGSFDMALTLVMCERHHVRRVATVDPAFEQFHLDLLPLAPHPA